MLIHDGNTNVLALKTPTFYELSGVSESRHTKRETEIIILENNSPRCRHLYKQKKNFDECNSQLARRAALAWNLSETYQHKQISE